MNSTQSSATDSSLCNQLTDAILKLISTIPETHEIVSMHPEMRAKLIARAASLKASAISGALAIPPGPLGMLTIIPDLLAVWKIQAQMVVDIAATYNKKANLSREVMIYCLFKHAASQAVRDLVVRAGERYLIKRTSLRAMQSILQKVGIKVTQKAAGKGISRWLPIIGAIGVAGYAYYDTNGVAKAAMELFSGEIEFDGSEVQS